MTKSRPALSVKRKQAALRSTSKSAASKGNATAKLTKNQAHHAELSCRICASNSLLFAEIFDSRERYSNELTETRRRADETIHSLQNNLTGSRSEVAALETRLTAALAEAEGLREKIERDTQRTIAENDRHGKQYVQKFREWEALVETEAKLGAEIEALDASRLLQANALKALREENETLNKALDNAIKCASEAADHIRCAAAARNLAIEMQQKDTDKLKAELALAKKDATDWALNHEKEKRRADETETKLEGARLIIIFLAVVALGAAGCMIFLEMAR